jgi:hypothetical protein
MRAKNTGIGKTPTAMIRRVLQCAICLVVISISGCGDLRFADEILVRPVNTATPISQAEVVTVRQVFDQVAKELIIRRLVELLNARLGPNRAKHIFYHYWTFA